MALRIAAGVLLLFFLPLPCATAQQQLPLPRLQRRKQALAESGVFPPGRSNLPDEAAGAYGLSPNPAEIIEMILNGTLTEHLEAGQSAPRRVSLPLLPEGGSSQ